jgi:hypothetical protein
MDWEELVKLHTALGAMAALPESIRELLVKWLEVPKPNGHDPRPPVLTPTPRPVKTKTKSRRAKSIEAHARAAEQTLLQAMGAQSDLTVVALANLVKASRSSTGERLRRLSVAGKVEKDHAGRWRLAREEPHPPGDEPRPTMASPS